MIKQFDEYPRRILSFPAIRPDESVPFPNLVTSLITLGHKIRNFKSKTFITNKKNARISIRLIEDLLIFLEEVRNGQSRVDDSIILSLTELHFVFQKVQFLLEYCKHYGAKLWMLMKAEEVANHFREIVRAIGVSLDILPLEGLDISIEVKELIEFVKKQALKGKFVVEMDDTRVSRKVLQVLDQFESGIAPEAEAFKLVLEYLGVASWSECNEEVKFLESEAGLEWLTDEKKEVGFLSSLMGFMIYCRCTLFDVVDSVSTKQPGDECSVEMNKMIRCLNPDDFRCPISLELMAEPVTLSTGHTYDRSSISRWFRAGNHTCPKTGQRLISTDLVPNVALKRLIKQYCLQNVISFPESGGDIKRDIARMIDVNNSVATQQAMQLLAGYLVGRLIVERSQVQNKIVYEVRLLTKTSVFNRCCQVEAGVIPALLILLSSMDPSTQENAIAALMNLSKYFGSKSVIVENGGLVLILDVLREGLKMEARQHAAGTLFYLASVEEYSVMIGEIAEVIPALMELLRNGTDRGKRNALVTIFGLLTHPGNHSRALAAGLVPLLISLLRSFKREDLVTDSFAILATLAEKLDGTMAILHAGAVPIIVEVLGCSHSRAAKEYCVSLLLSLSINGMENVVPLLLKNPSLMAPLYSLLTEGTSRASRKASALIRILHQFNEKSSLGSITPALPQEQSVHVW